MIKTSFSLTGGGAGLLKKKKIYIFYYRLNVLFYKIKMVVNTTPDFPLKIEFKSCMFILFFSESSEVPKCNRSMNKESLREITKTSIGRLPTV